MMLFRFPAFRLPRGSLCRLISKDASVPDPFRPRLEAIQKRFQEGHSSYPSLSPKLDRIQIPEFLAKYSHLKEGQKIESSVSLSGRILSIRESGAGLYFIDIRQANEKVQIFASKANFPSLEEFNAIKELQIGDIVDISGAPGRTKRGELSLYSSKISLLTPALHPIPFKYGLNDQAKRVRKRYLDLLVNPTSLQKFQIRAKVISLMRRFLDERGFLEVETPVLFPSVGGANARPFMTFANALQEEFSLRISPELQLKQLVIGGLERVYEIGKQFRNEGIDSTHNPEFTTCEFYQSYADFQSLIKTTEDMLSFIVKEIHGTTKVKVFIKEGKEVKDELASPSEDEIEPLAPLPAETPSNIKEYEIDFAPPYRVIEFLPEIEKHLGTKLPPLDHPDAVPLLLEAMENKGISTPEPHTIGKLLDHLSSLFIEPQCVAPTFLVGHPKAMSPLAKEHPSLAGATARFELFVAGKELVNAYSELNDPFEQRSRFAQQAKDKQAGDDEAQVLDEDFCTALEYGLPPTAGWGMGIDRFCMFLSGSTTIRDVLFFPMVKNIKKKDEKPK